MREFSGRRMAPLSRSSIRKTARLHRWKVWGSSVAARIPSRQSNLSTTSAAKDVREMILRFAFRRPARQDLDLATLPGQMPPLSQVKTVDYDEDAWTASRAETLQKILTIIRSTR